MTPVCEAVLADKERNDKESLARCAWRGPVFGAHPQRINQPRDPGSTLRMQ
jgi:hypothetical protein